MNASRLGPLGLLALAACATATPAMPAPRTIEVAADESSSPPVAPSPPSAPPPVEPTEAPSVAPSEAPTWSAIYARYFGPGSAGDCARSRACHAAVMNDAPAAYSWLVQRGYIAGSQSPLVSKSNSCLTWFGGNMPPRGGADDDAARELDAWVAAGATNN